MCQASLALLRVAARGCVLTPRTGPGTTVARDVGAGLFESRITAMPTLRPLTAYVHMHALDGVSATVSRLRADALQALRDELAALGGVHVTPIPQGADLDVEITNVLRVDEVSRARTDQGRQRILVIRLGRKGERLDFVCSDGRSAMPAERQAARRIRGWVAGDEAAVPLRPAAVETAIAFTDSHLT